MGGTAINLGLTRQVNALGLSFIIPEQMFDGDIKLLAGNETATLLTGNRTLVGSFSGTDYYAYFLGLVTSGGFNSASIQYGPNTDGAFFYNADDITVAITPSTPLPEPTSPLLFLAGALSTLAVRKRKRV